MQEAIIEPLLEAAVFGVEVALFVLLTAAGVFSEHIGLETVATSGDTIGLWYVYVGFVALYVGVYLVGYDRLLPRLQQRLQSA